MTYSLLWLPKVLTDAGLTVIEVPGWQNRGHGDEGKVLGVLCHHTCGPLHGDLPDLNVLIDGRPDLGGPLCNLGLGRSGHYWMIAAGKGWHAGRGHGKGSPMGMLISSVSKLRTLAPAIAMAIPLSLGPGTKWMLISEAVRQSLSISMPSQ